MAERDSAKSVEDDGTRTSGAAALFVARSAVTCPYGPIDQRRASLRPPTTWSIGFHLAPARAGGYAARMSSNGSTPRGGSIDGSDTIIAWVQTSSRPGNVTALALRPDSV